MPVTAMLSLIQKYLGKNTPEIAQILAEMSLFIHKYWQYI